MLNSGCSVAIRPKLLRQCFIDDGDLGRIRLGRLVRREDAAAQDRQTDRGKIICADGIETRGIGQTFGRAARLGICRNLQAGALDGTTQH